MIDPSTLGGAESHYQRLRISSRIHWETWGTTPGAATSALLRRDRASAPFRPGAISTGTPSGPGASTLLASSLISLGRLDEARVAIARLEKAERNKETVAELKRALTKRRSP
jgi:hypothetical protein